MSEPFWKTKTLADMTRDEWESLCDGCGRCCLNKLEDEESGKYYYTEVGCRLLDGETCRCGDYPNRHDRVDDCEQLTPQNVSQLNWLPPSCAYRLLDQGKDLYWWHPLVSGDPESVHIAGVSIRGRLRGDETEIGDDQLENYVVRWPVRLPKRAKEPKK